VIYSEVFTTNLPCKRKYTKPPLIEEIPDYKYYRKDSNGTEIFVNSEGRKVYIKTDSDKIFPLEVPIQVDFEITQKCNLNCRHCFIKKKDEKFSKVTWKVLEKIIESGVMMIEISGGEPLLVEDVFEMIDYIHKNNRMVTMSTNGTLITPEIAKKMCNLEKIYISLDGPKKIHDKIRGVGSFDCACNGIKNLNKCGIKPIISTTISKFNLYSLSELAKEIKEKDLKIVGLFLIFLEPSNADENFSKQCFAHSERSKVASIIENMKLDVPKVVMHFKPNAINALYYGCFFRLTICQITPSGNVLSCPIIGDCQGNLLEEDFKTIWKRMYEHLSEIKPKKCNLCQFNLRCFPCVYDQID
jgi:MoaA/NifB/PqqE/SkfB family radical SAM enzyme